MSLCRELGYTLSELGVKETYANLRLWYGLRLVEIDEARQERLNQEVLENLDKNKGRFTGGH